MDGFKVTKNAVANTQKNHDQPNNSANNNSANNIIISTIDAK